MEAPFKNVETLRIIEREAEELLSIIDWEAVKSRDLRANADRVVDPDHRTLTMELVESYRDEIERGTESRVFIRRFLTDAAAEGLIPWEWVDTDPDQPARAYTRLNGSRRTWHADLVRARKATTPMPATWDEATTLVLRSEQMARAELLAHETAERMSALVQAPVGENTRWLTMGTRALEERQADLASDDTAFKDLVEQALARQEHRREQGTFDDGPELALSWLPPEERVTSGQQMLIRAGEASEIETDADRTISELYRNVMLTARTSPITLTQAAARHRACDDAIHVISQVWARRMGEEENGTQDLWLEGTKSDLITFFGLKMAQVPFNIFEMIRDHYGPEDTSDIEALFRPPVNDWQTFADAKNPFLTMLLTWQQGMPLVSCSQEGMTFVLPSAGIVDEIRDARNNA